MKIFIILFLAICNWATCSDTFWDLKREYDDHGRLSKEDFPNGKSIEIAYDEMNRVVEISLGEHGSVLYQYDDTNLLKVSRVSPNGQTLYTHSYEYDPNTGGLLCENLISNLGQISYKNDLGEKIFQIDSPYSQEICRFNPEGLITSHFLNGKTFEYDYNGSNSLRPIKATKEFSELEYDTNGNLIKKISKNGRDYFEFDQYGNLIVALTNKAKISYIYDGLDRRIAKKIQQKANEEIETYLYFGKNEIAIFAEDGTLKQLRIPGLSFNDNFVLPVAIEKEGEIYATIHDYRGNLLKLISTRNREPVSIPPIEPFGENLADIVSATPWLFASKHYDTETNLVYFGTRYYDPELEQWITPDPYGMLQHSNVYLYCLGNPLSYCDPDGKFAISIVSLAWGAGAVVSFPAWGSAALVTAAGAAAGWATYEVIQKVKEGKQRDGTPRSNTAQNAQFDDAVREIERKTGKNLSDNDRRKLHDQISGQNFGYHDIVEEGYWLFNG